MTLIEQLHAVIIAIAQDITNNANNSGNSGNSDTSDISLLLPRKIGASQRWYQSGLRHGAEYPYPYAAGSTGFTGGVQYFTPFTALEDATIKGLEIQCNPSKGSGTVSLGIYASDSNNDLANPLFTSSPISCATAGIKNAPCNVQITKGEVYWLSSLSIGTLNFSRNSTGSLLAIKGAVSANQSSVVGYYTTGNTSMGQSAPTNKLDEVTGVPRVMFITG